MEAGHWLRRCTPPAPPHPPRRLLTRSATRGNSLQPTPMRSRGGRRFKAGSELSRLVEDCRRPEEGGWAGAAACQAGSLLRRGSVGCALWYQMLCVGRRAAVWPGGGGWRCGSRIWPPRATAAALPAFGPSSWPCLHLWLTSCPPTTACTPSWPSADERSSDGGGPLQDLLLPGRWVAVACCCCACCCAEPCPPPLDTRPMVIHPIRCMHSCVGCTHTV